MNQVVQSTLDNLFGNTALYSERTTVFYEYFVATLFLKADTIL